MKDADVIDFLQWALPQLRMRWTGFRKVRKQVKKRLMERLDELKIRGLDAYRDYLAEHPEEWDAVDAACRITISRFYRDHDMFDALRQTVMRDLALRSVAERRPVRAWSVGSASGEEPYTLTMIWHFAIVPKVKKASFEVVATDINAHMLERAAAGLYPEGCLSELPREWKSGAFDVVGSEYRIRETFRNDVVFVEQDIREEQPDGLFDLVACRYLAFTYFDLELQQEVIERLRAATQRGGYLVLGGQESLPPGTPGFMPCYGTMPIYRRV